MRGGIFGEGVGQAGESLALTVGVLHPLLLHYPTLPLHLGQNNLASKGRMTIFRAALTHKC